MSLTQAQILDRVSTLLQDGSYTGGTGKRWLPAELRQYLYDAQHEFIRLTEFPIVTSSVTIVEATSTFNRPATPPLMDLTRVRINNTSVEIPILAPNVLDEHNVVMGQLVDANWRGQTGPIRAIILEHMSAPTFDVYPTPTATDPLFSSTLVSPVPVFDVTGDSSTDILTTTAGIITSITDTAILKFDGVIDPPRDRLRYTTAQGGTGHDGTTYGDSETPLISPMFHEALVYGVAERAYLKENELRNIEKSSLFRQRFLEQVGYARRTEPQHSLTRNRGINKKRMRVSWRWR
jgi:hypothetical protein